MKKIVSMILIGIIGISIIPRTLINEKHVVLEGSTSVYTKDEVDSLLSTIRTNITNNTNEITNIKNEIKTLNDSLSDYVLKTELNETNSNIDDLNAILESNTARIEALESSSGSGETEVIDTIFKSGVLKTGVTLSNITNNGTNLYASGNTSISISGIDNARAKTIRIQGYYTMQGSDNRGYLGVGYVTYSMGYASIEPTLGMGTNKSFDFYLPYEQTISGKLASGGYTSTLTITSIELYS